MNKYLEEEWNEHLQKVNEKERQALMKDLRGYSEQDITSDRKIGLDGVE